MTIPNMQEKNDIQTTHDVSTPNNRLEHCRFGRGAENGVAEFSMGDSSHQMPERYCCVKLKNKSG